MCTFGYYRFYRLNIDTFENRMYRISLPFVVASNVGDFEHHETIIYCHYPQVQTMYSYAWSCLPALTHFAILLL